MDGGSAGKGVMYTAIVETLGVSYKRDEITLSASDAFDLAKSGSKKCANTVVYKLSGKLSMEAQHVAESVTSRKGCWGPTRAYLRSDSSGAFAPDARCS